MRAFCIGGPLDGWWQRIDDGQETMEAPEPVSVEVARSDHSVSARAQTRSVTVYRRVEIKCGDAERLFWVTATEMSPMQVIDALIDGYPGAPGG